jgi:molecular chaperone IbpA
MSNQLTTHDSLLDVNFPSLVQDLVRQTIGFDPLFERIKTRTRTSNFPPYDIVKTGEHTYEIRLAVSGFLPDQLEVITKENALTIVGKGETQTEGSTFLYRGIAKREFERQFTLAENVVAKGAALDAGILTIFLEHITLEENKAKKIAITYNK